MSEGQVSTGSCMAISAGTAPATEDGVGYAALAWAEWGEVTQFGDIGPTSAIIKFSTVCDGVVNKRAGSKDFGTMTMEAAFDEANAAQVLLKAAAYAVPSSVVYARLTLSTGAILYFRAYAADFKTKVGGADSVLMLGVSFEVDGAPIDA